MILQPIDDDEFNIPAVEFEPSLESILNDLDLDSLSDEEGCQGISQPETDIPNNQLVLLILLQYLK